MLLLYKSYFHRKEKRITTILKIVNNFAKKIYKTKHRQKPSMDLNVPITIVNNNQENNELLLNAIKNKFAAQSSNEVAAFSPPKFNIPNLKVFAKAKETTTTINSRESTTKRDEPATQLNQFLLKQLQEKQTNDNGFQLPQLLFDKQLTSDTKTSAFKFQLPVLQTSSPANITSLTSAVNALKVEEGSQNIPIPSLATTPAIDLTTALASKLSHQGTPPTRDFSNKTKAFQNTEDFDIPFIDCDHPDGSRKYIVLDTANEYCITDISQLPLRPSNTEPSAIGQFLNFATKYEAPLPLKCFSSEFQQQNVKHTIVPFQFDTKSPDDIVLEALSKYHRRYFN